MPFSVRILWSHVGPWVESVRENGSDELTRVMEKKALEEVNDAGARAQNELERAEAAL